MSLFTLVALSIVKLKSLFAQEIPFIGYKLNKVMKHNYSIMENTLCGCERDGLYFDLHGAMDFKE